MRLLQYLITAFAALVGVFAMLRNKAWAREAARQAYELTGRRFDERIYSVGYFVAGLIMTVGALVTLSGMFFGFIDVP
ncbi:hypothetical protein L6Q96_05805 [Candidatus Binatia bacterium]|nr:hypothetical protein [Candidatus Binatia bacterium]